MRNPTPTFDLSDAPTYGLHHHLDGVAFDDAVARARDALAAEGFGVLTEIDVRTTMKAKLDFDTTPYVILGACNPALAREALLAEAGVGLLLPCNVVVAATAKGSAIAAIDPLALFAVVKRPDVEPLAADVRARLVRAIAAA